MLVGVWGKKYYSEEVQMEASIKRVNEKFPPYRIVKIRATLLMGLSYLHMIDQQYHSI